MASPLDPFHQVRSSCSFVVESAAHVSIDMAALKAMAADFSTNDIALAREGVAWDAEGWHYAADAKSNGPLTCQYIFVLDSLNFCFWPTANLEYEQLATALRDVLAQNPSAFDGARLCAMTEEVLASWFPGYEVPLIEERTLRLRELGHVLVEYYQGSAANMVSASKNSACALVTNIIRMLPGFRDTAVYKGRLVHFYKRAQILVGDLWAAYGRQGPGQPYYFSDIDQLTMFADYRVPQILRATGVMKYSDETAAVVNSRTEIPFGSEVESEIRAATVVAVELLQKELAALGVDLLVIEVDWLLWQRGEVAKDNILPHHRTLTIYY